MAHWFILVVHRWFVGMVLGVCVKCGLKFFTHTYLTNTPLCMPWIASERKYGTVREFASCTGPVNHLQAVLIASYLCTSIVQWGNLSGMISMYTMWYSNQQPLIMQNVYKIGFWSKCEWWSLTQLNVVTTGATLMASTVITGRNRQAYSACVCE